MRLLYWYCQRGLAELIQQRLWTVLAAAVGQREHIDGGIGQAVTIETAILQRVLEAHVREQLTALADLRVSLE